MTTSDTNRAVIKPETAGTDNPYIHLYIGCKDEAGRNLVAPATVFVSHAWRYKLADTVIDVMEQHAASHPNAYFWFDLFTNDQNAVASKDFDWFSTTFRDSIRDIGQVLLVLSPWNDPLPIRRAWCLFEISNALSESGVEFLVNLPESEVSTMSMAVLEDSECLIQALSNIQAEKAEATSAADRDLIFSVIQSSSTGGFAKLNDQVKSALRQWYVGQLADLVENSPSDHELVLSAAQIARGFGLVDNSLHHALMATQFSTEQVSEKYLGRAYNALANVYQDKSELDKSLEYHHKSLTAKLNTCGGEGHPDVATCYNNMANVYKVKGKLGTALEYHNKSLTIRLNTLGDSHPEVATSYNNLATVYFDKAELDSALHHYNKSLDIRIKELGEHHPDVASLFSNIANVHLDKNELEEALKFQQRSLASRVSTLGEHHPIVASSYNNIALVYQKIGDLDMALDYHNRSLSLRLSTIGSDHPDTSNCYHNMAIVYRDKGQLEKALECNNKSYDIRIKAFGPEHPHVAISLNNLAHVYHKLGELETALGYYQRSLDIRTSTYGESHTHVATSCNNLAEVYVDQGELEIALEYHSKALTIREALLDEGHPDLVQSRKNKANIERLMDEGSEVSVEESYSLSSLGGYNIVTSQAVTFSSAEQTKSNPHPIGQSSMIMMRQSASQSTDHIQQVPQYTSQSTSQSTREIDLNNQLSALMMTSQAVSFSTDEQTKSSQKSFQKSSQKSSPPRSNMIMMRQSASQSTN